MFGIQEIAKRPGLHPCQEPQHYVTAYGPYFIDIRGIWNSNDLLNEWRNMQYEMPEANIIMIIY